jgi:hypothetical protein
MGNGMNMPTPSLKEKSLKEKSLKEKRSAWNIGLYCIR